MSYTPEQIKSMGKRELLEVAESFNIEMDTSMPKPQRVETLLEFFANFKGPETDVEWEDDQETQTDTVSQTDDEEKVSGSTESNESNTVYMKPDDFDKFLEKMDETQPIGDKLSMAAKRLDDEGFDFETKNEEIPDQEKTEEKSESVTEIPNEEKSDEEKTDTGESQEKSESEAEEKVSKFDSMSAQEIADSFKESEKMSSEAFEELSKVQPISGDNLDGLIKETPAVESHDVEEFTLKQASLGRITQYQPGVAFIKKDGSGKDRGVVPVHKKVYDSLVAVHDGKKCNFEMIDLSEFDNVEKLSIARVVKNLIDFGHVYIRSNHSSGIFYL